MKVYRTAIAPLVRDSVPPGRTPVLGFRHAAGYAWSGPKASFRFFLIGRAWDMISWTRYMAAPHFIPYKNRLQEAVSLLQCGITQEVLDDVVLGFVRFDGITFFLQPFDDFREGL